MEVMKRLTGIVVVYVELIICVCEEEDVNGLISMPSLSDSRNYTDLCFNPL